MVVSCCPGWQVDGKTRRARAKHGAHRQLAGLHLGLDAGAVHGHGHQLHALEARAHQQVTHSELGLLHNACFCLHSHRAQLQVHDAGVLVPAQGFLHRRRKEVRVVLSVKGGQNGLTAEWSTTRDCGSQCFEATLDWKIPPRVILPFPFVTHRPYKTNRRVEASTRSILAATGTKQHLRAREEKWRRKSKQEMSCFRSSRVLAFKYAKTSTRSLRTKQQHIASLFALKNSFTQNHTLA